MPKPKKQNKKDNGIKVRPDKSSLGEFVKRALPTDQEVEKFDEYTQEEARDGNIEESLSEIYQDEKGQIVNVKKLDIKRGRGFFYWFFNLIFMAVIIAGIAYGFYYIYYEKGSSGGDIRLSIAAEENVAAGEEFFYTVGYKNLSNIAISNIEIKLVYPENFIYLDSVPAPASSNDFWKINNLDAHRSELIKIKGKIIGEKDERDIITAVMIYTPANFSSEFRKEAAFENKISGIGVDLNVNAPSGVLVDDESEIVLLYKKEEKSFINNFKVIINPLENMIFTFDSPETEEEGEAAMEYLGEGAWQINKIKEEEQEFIIPFKITEKVNPTEELTILFEYSENKEKSFKLYEEKINFEVIKSDLNLNLIINGSRNDQGIDIGQTLNYSIVYANKGETSMEDIIIMAVLKSGALDWESLNDPLNGAIGDNTISWGREEIAELAVLEPEKEGVIDFSINILSSERINVEPGKKYEVESYAQFSIGNIEIKENEDTKSNTIINKVNSDLTLNEQIRYFSDDNIAVGSGPLPPKVGEATSYKIYWKLTNNLHELDKLQVLVDLPDYVNWDNKNRSTVGTVQYIAGNNKVVWNIGRLPISVYKAEAEFNINIIPTENDIDKILVLLSGTLVEAVDSETGSTISKTIKAKTTRLEDDDIAETDGRVVK